MKICEIKHAEGIIEIEVNCPKQKVSFLNIGATFVRWLTTSGEDIIAHYEDPEDYLDNPMYLGANVGLNAGRISDGAFELGGVKYQMEEKAKHFLHSGKYGYGTMPFDYEVELNTDDLSIIHFFLTYKHPLLPGTQQVSIRYWIEKDIVKILYDVTSDALMLCNPTQHAYFNIDGDFSKPIDSHTLKVNADEVLWMDNRQIGTHFGPVDGTPLDFRKETTMMDKIEAVKIEDPVNFGIDHFFLWKDGEITLSSKKNNASLVIKSTFPGVTVYTTNYPTKDKVQTGAPLPLHSAVCMEPEFVGNAINMKGVPYGHVSKEEPFHQEITYEWIKK